MQKITELDNGLRIVTQNMPGLETVSMGIWNYVGGRDETKEINGVAHLLEHMAFKGTKTKSALEIMEKVESVGGYINAYTSEEITAYWVKMLSQDLHIGIDIISDILQNSTFEPKELERERGVILQEIGMYLDTPAHMVGDYWLKTAFPDQPIGRLILGKKEIIKSIEREKIVNFMQSNYHPSKMVVSAAGKINHDEFVEQNFMNEVMENPALIPEFNNYKTEKAPKYKIEDLTTFPISNTAVRNGSFTLNFVKLNESFCEENSADYFANKAVLTYLRGEHEKKPPKVRDEGTRISAGRPSCGEPPGNRIGHDRGYSFFLERLQSRNALRRSVFLQSFAGITSDTVAPAAVRGVRCAHAAQLGRHTFRLQAGGALAQRKFPLRGATMPSTQPTKPPPTKPSPTKPPPSSSTTGCRRHGPKRPTTSRR